MRIPGKLMSMGGRKLFGWILWILGGVFTVAKFAADWIGRSTVAEDATDLWGKLSPMAEFLQRQPDLWFYALMLTLIGVGAFLAFWRRWPAAGQVAATAALPPPVAAKPQSQKPPTIEALSKSDFADTLKVSQGLEYNELSYKAFAHVCFNMKAHSKFLVMFFPATPHTANLIAALADIAPDLVSQVQGGVGISFKDPGDVTEVDVNSATLASRVYVYHETRLSLQEMARADQLFRDKGLSLVMRGPDYATSRWISEKASPAKVAAPQLPSDTEEEKPH